MAPPELPSAAVAPESQDVNSHERRVVVDVRLGGGVCPVAEKSAWLPAVLPEVEPARWNEAFVRQVQRGEQLV